MRVKVDLLESKNAENESKIGLQNNVIYSNELNSEHSIGAPNERPLHSVEDNKIGLNNGKIGSSGDSSTRMIVPSSCRKLAIAGHSFDGLYLVQNPNSRKIEAVFCDFGTSGKSVLKALKSKHIFVK